MELTFNAWWHSNMGVWAEFIGQLPSLDNLPYEYGLGPGNFIQSRLLRLGAPEAPAGWLKYSDARAGGVG